MVRIRIISVILMGSLLSTFASCDSGDKEEDAPKPNLLIIHTDEHSFRTIGAYRELLPEGAQHLWGNAIVKTPNLDRLAKEGAIATRFYANSPVCTPSRGCFQTGLYANKHGAEVNNNHMNEGIQTFARTLQKNGYHTIYLGKWHLSGHTRIWGSQFDDDFGWTDNEYLWNRGHFKKIVENEGQRNPSTFNYKEIGDEESYTTDWLVNQTLEKIEDTKDKPFCCMVSIPDPHGPDWTRAPYDTMYPVADIDLPASFYKKQFPGWVKYDKRIHSEQHMKEIMSQYFGMVKLLDDNIGKILNRLEELDILDNTIVVFTSDHGDLCGEYHRIDKGLPYEASAKVPFIVRWPGKIKEGLVVEETLSTIDFLPTILSIMNVQSSGEEDGQDASSCFLEGEAPANWDDIVFLAMDNESWLSAISGPYKLILSPRDMPYLFNTERDPLEMENIVNNPENREIVKTLALKLKDYCLRHKDFTYLRYSKVRHDIEYLISNGYTKVHK